MKTLLLLRHAKASKDTGGPDHDRPLNDRGNRDAPRIGTLLREPSLLPDLIISSTATRARQTAQAVAESCGYHGSLDLRDDLYMARPAAFTRVLRGLDDDRERVLVVAHNPGLEEFLEDLTGTPETLPTAALAHLTLSIDSWKLFESTTPAQLQHLWRPREL